MDVNSKLTATQGQRLRLQCRVQRCLDLGKSCKTDPSLLTDFMSRASRLTNSLRDYDALVKECFELELQKNPSIDQGQFSEMVEAFEDSYFEVMGIYDSNKKASSTTTANASATHMTTTSMQHKTAKLPKIPLRKFDGTMSDWTEFKANFESLIHSNESLHDTSKLHYLKASLEGTALSVIKNLPDTERNYLIAWNAILKRYDNNRLLGADYLNKMINFPTIKKENSAELTTFVATFHECYQALRQLNIMEMDNFIALHIGLKCLPTGVKKAFERSLTDPNVMPSITDLVEFVQKQIRVLEITSTTGSSPSNAESPKKQAASTNPKQTFCSSSSSAKQTSASKPGTIKVTEPCPTCNETHLLFHCDKFRQLTLPDREKVVQNKKLCRNCLRNGHLQAVCKSRYRCQYCKKKHNTLLHDHGSEPPNGKTSSTFVAETRVDESSPREPNSGAMQVLLAKDRTDVERSVCLLGTAVVLATDRNGAHQPVRILIDSAAMSSFITTDCVRRLNLPIDNQAPSISGLANAKVQTRGTVSCSIKPRHRNSPTLQTQAVVLDQISSALPGSKVPNDVLSRFRTFTLADPNFTDPAPVDLLIGADLFPNIYDGRKANVGPNYPTALGSIFGWVITGKYIPSQSAITAFLSVNPDPIGQLLQKFWEIEELPTQPVTNPDDILAEDIFKRNFSRDKSGRYIVPLPMRDYEVDLGNSYSLAVTRLRNLERKFERDPELKTAYLKFMNEYQELDHMAPVPPDQQGTGKFYIPHHGVWKLSSSTTKLRVVFDGSLKTNANMSLNDALLAGPKLQKDITEVLMNFRLHSVVFTTDICKMYRQILLQPEHRSFQRILWRKDPRDPIQEFELKTVTYGEKPAPFLALRSLVQLVDDHGSDFPEASAILSTSIYVDDILGGASDIVKAKIQRDQLIALLDRGCFKLAKWASNRPELLSDLLTQDLEKPVDLGDMDDAISVLGLMWHPSEDIFTYKCTPFDLLFTKRSVLSVIAKTYDVLGLIAPIVFVAKHFIQKLWILGIDWDTPLPVEHQREWENYVTNLKAIENVKIPRYASVTEPNMQCILIGFCDASEYGYAACIYLRVSAKCCPTTCTLMTAKSKVAPLKVQSIPRLELCGASLLSSLVTTTTDYLSKTINLAQVITFTDSTIVLDWLRTPPYRLKTFVANRVVHILETLPPQSWNHVRSEDNPADLATRGCTPAELSDNQLWWHGPSWLQLPLENWPKTVPEPHPQQTEVKEKYLALLTQTLSNELTELLLKKSTLIPLLRTTAWIFRFATNVRATNKDKLRGPLIANELKAARKYWVQQVQRNHFKSELHRHMKSSPKAPSAEFKHLDTFLDTDGILRVGGRLQNTILEYDAIHPILLPKKSHFTDLIIDYHHLRTLHGGPRLTLASINSRYWIIGGRSIIREKLHNCIPCCKAKPVAIQPPMGDLPDCRVREARPFLNCGIDYGGPFLIKENKLRNARTTKAYIALFVCMATKAIHLELVSDLTTPALLAAISRFVSRRGVCVNMYSDNGSNFIGANNQLREFYQFLRSEKTKSDVMTYLADREISWHFIPPKSPHFGGLWEAGIKSTKYHLKRVIGTQVFTFEEMSTLLARIEATLNSRPLSPLSPDVNDLGALTPGHLLIGSPMIAIPERNVESVPKNRLTRWQLVQQANQSFWKLWHTDYLNTLRQRTKWTQPTLDLQVGRLVLIQENNVPPLKWMLGRVVKGFPGKDNVSRVFEVKTPTGIFKRPATRLCPLPID